MISVFMGEANAASLPQNSANSGVGQEDDIQGAQTKAAATGNGRGNRQNNNNKVRQLLAGLLGGGGNAAKGDKSTGPPETMIAATAGAGSEQGLPTANEDGTVDLTFRQVS